jgi:Bacterial inner membrane protein
MSGLLLRLGWDDWIACLAAVLGLSAYFHRSPTLLKVQMGFASQIWAIYFLMLELTTAELIQTGTGLRTWVSIYVNKNPRFVIPYLVFVNIGYCMVMLLTWRGAVSLLPTLAAINSTIAYLFKNKTMRLMFLGSSAFSLSFAVLIESPILIALECLGIGINLLAILKINRGVICT